MGQRKGKGSLGPILPSMGRMVTRNLKKLLKILMYSLEKLLKMLLCNQHLTFLCSQQMTFLCSQQMTLLCRQQIMLKVLLYMLKMLLRPCSLPHLNPKYFLFHLSHQIFRRMHGTLNLGPIFWPERLTRSRLAVLLGEGPSTLLNHVSPNKKAPSSRKPRTKATKSPKKGIAKKLIPRKLKPN